MCHGDGAGLGAPAAGGRASWDALWRFRATATTSLLMIAANNTPFTPAVSITCARTRRRRLSCACVHHHTQGRRRESTPQIQTPTTHGMRGWLHTSSSVGVMLLSVSVHTNRTILLTAAASRSVNELRLLANAACDHVRTCDVSAVEDTCEAMLQTYQALKKTRPTSSP